MFSGLRGEPQPKIVGTPSLIEFYYSILHDALVDSEFARRGTLIFFFAFLKAVLCVRGKELRYDDQVRSLRKIVGTPRMLGQEEKTTYYCTLLPGVKLKTKPVQWDFCTKFRKASVFFHVRILIGFSIPSLSRSRKWVAGCLDFFFCGPLGRFLS